jgi:hypothetical protein
VGKAHKPLWGAVKAALTVVLHKRDVVRFFETIDE